MKLGLRVIAKPGTYSEVETPEERPERGRKTQAPLTFSGELSTARHGDHPTLAIGALPAHRTPCRNALKTGAVDEVGRQRIATRKKPRMRMRHVGQVRNH